VRLRLGVGGGIAGEFVGFYALSRTFQGKKSIKNFSDFPVIQNKISGAHAW
jgi:hypothetical protein